MADDDSEAKGVSLTDRLHGVYSNQPRWLTLPVRIVIAIALIVGLVFLGRSIHHHMVDNNGANTAANTNSASQSIANNKQKTTSDSNSSGNNKSSSGSNKKTPSASASSTQLPNSGPGNVAVIFLTTTFGAAALHYTISLRRQTS